MSSPLHTLLTLAATCTLLASCASSTMDSIPTKEQMEGFTQSARGQLSSEYAALSDQRNAGTLTDAQYYQEYARLEERAIARANTLAWNSHEMAENERRHYGIPTAGAAASLQVPNATSGGAGGQSQFRSALSQYNTSTGMGGSSTTVNPSTLSGRVGNGGMMGASNYPGSIYDRQ
jgi:hypothetical protein